MIDTHDTAILGYFLLARKKRVRRSTRELIARERDEDNTQRDGARRRARDRSRQAGTQVNAGWRLTSRQRKAERGDRAEDSAHEREK